MRPLADVEQIIQGFEAMAEEEETEPPKTYVWGRVVVKV